MKINFITFQFSFKFFQNKKCQDKKLQVFAGNSWTFVFLFRTRKMVETNKRILDQTCFACKKIPSFDDRFTSDNQYACPEMSYIICQSCKDNMIDIQKNPLMFIHSIICLNSVWYCCHYNPHKLKRCSIQVKYMLWLCTY